MTYLEAQDLTERLNANAKLRAEVVRMLPREIDPPARHDNGWDVEVQVIHRPGFDIIQIDDVFEVTR